MKIIFNPKKIFKKIKCVNIGSSKEYYGFTKDGRILPYKIEVNPKDRPRVLKQVVNKVDVYLLRGGVFGYTKKKNKKSKQVYGTRKKSRKTIRR